MNKKAGNRAGICGASEQATGGSVLSSWLPVAFKNERPLQVQGSQMSSLDSNMAYSHWQQYLRHHSGDSFSPLRQLAALLCAESRTAELDTADLCLN